MLPLPVERTPLMGPVTSYFDRWPVMGTADQMRQCAFTQSDITSRIEHDIVFEQLRLNPSAISAEAWCKLSGFNIKESLGIALYKVICTCRKKYGAEFYIPQIINTMKLDSRTSPKTVEALVNRLDTMQERGLSRGQSLRRYGRCPLILSALARNLFRKHSIARRRGEFGP